MPHLLFGLFDFLYEIPILTVVLVSWAITPGMIYVLGFIGESRILPFWASPRMLLPGDFFLGITLNACICGLRFYTDIENPALQSWIKWWPIFVTVGAFIVMILMRTMFDGPNYDYRSVISPTKIWHDVMCYFVLGTLLFTTGITFLFFGEWSWFGTTLKLTAIFFVALWIICGFIDKQRDLSPEVIHPSTWQPIWQTGALVKYYGKHGFRVVRQFWEVK